MLLYPGQYITSERSECQFYHLRESSIWLRSEAPRRMVRPEWLVEMREESGNSLPSAMRDAVQRIAADNRSGAAEILSEAGKLFALLNARNPAHSTLNREIALQAVTDVAIALVQAQPNMSPLLKLASAAMTAARESVDAANVLEEAARAAALFVEVSTRAAAATAANGALVISEGSRILTHSRSSTLFEAFVKAKRDGRHFSIVVTESRPLLEGRTLAEALAREGVPVTLVADAAAALAMEEVDCVIVGADTVTPEFLVNKIGTRMIALAALERNLPIHALCDTSKFVREVYSAQACEMSESAEVWPNPPSGVRVINRYFEPTPLAHFTSIITEDGAHSSEDASLVAWRGFVDSVLLNALKENDSGILK